MRSIALLAGFAAHAYASGPPAGTMFCGKVQNLVGMKIEVDDNSHVDLTAKIFMVPHECKNEDYTFDASSNEIKLSNLGTAKDCVGKIFHTFKEDPSSLKMVYDSAKNVIHFTMNGVEPVDFTTTGCHGESMFEEFEQAFGKVYASVEERAQRMAIFIANLALIEEMQLSDLSATYSHLTPFADWTTEEFAARNTLQADLSFNHSLAPQAELLDVSNLPDNFDWRSQGAVNAVKDQKQCGSCWAFATVANVEGVNFVHNKKLVSLSEQELVDCDKKTGDMGCQGGLPMNAFQDMAKNKVGLELETDYPYTATDGKCQAAEAKEQVFIQGSLQISQDEDQIAAALMKNGPLAIGINANAMQWYHGGIANPFKILCNPTKLDHGVAIVGFGTENAKKYWIIRNSWGTGWGEKGYYRLIRGKGSCGVNTMVSTATMSTESQVMV